MEKMKNNKGVTLIALSITVLVTLILIGATVYQTTIGVDDAMDSKLNAEVQMVQHAVLEQYAQFKMTKNTKYLVGDKLELSQVEQIAEDMGITLVDIPDTYTNKNYYRLTKEHLAEIGLTNAEHQYIVNYVSGEVINFSQKKDNSGKALYVQGDTFKSKQ